MGLMFGDWTGSSDFIWSVILAVLLGLLVSYLANSDRLHRVLRYLGVTHQTSFSSEWYGALCQNRGYVVLHLAGERRLYGWPEEWPSAPDQGHFVIAEAEWLIENNQSIPLPTVKKMVVKASDVEFLELMMPIHEMEAEDGRS
jgi:hypothetical protein